MIDECEQEEMDFLNVELNWWVDTVLKVVYDNQNGRDIIFSSFHPDICMMLATQTGISLTNFAHSAKYPHTLPHRIRFL